MRDWFQGGLLDPSAIIENTAVPFQSGSEVAAWTASPAEAPSATPGAIIVAGRLYRFDPADTTTVHDGQWTCVSLDGRRYKASDLPLITAVETASLTSPPAITSTLFGKAWIVPAAATGAWAGRTGSIAVATGRGWVFIAPRVGMALYVTDLEAFAHLTPEGDWLIGMGTASPGTVTAAALIWPFGVIVENTTTNTPPTAPGTRAYVVGSAPTGAWAGRANDIAIGPTGGWAFLPPVEGAQVWDRARAAFIRFASGAWTTDSGQVSSIRYQANAGALTLAGNTYSYAVGTAPTASNTASSGLVLTLAARVAGNVVRVRHRFSCLTAGGVGALALFVDGASVAAQWLPIAMDANFNTYEVEFLIAAADALPHTYEVRYGAVVASPANRITVLEEASVLA